MDRKVYFPFFFFSLLALPVSAQYRLLPDMRVNQDSVGIYIHYPGYPNGRSVAVFGGTVFILWQGNQETGSEAYHIYLSRSTDGGINFLPPVRVDSGDLSSDANFPALALDQEGRIYCAFNERSVNQSHLFVCKSTDGGASFFQKVRVTREEAVFPQLPSLTCDRLGFVYLTWTDWQDTARRGSFIYFSKSSDGGRTFTPPLRVSPSIPELHASYSSLAVDGRGNIHIVWRDDRYSPYNYHVYYSKSTDGGNSFLPSILVDSSTGNYSATFPSITVDSTGMSIYVLYKDRSSGQHQIYLSKSQDGGQSFFGHIRVDSLGPYPSDWPQISLREPNRLFFTWSQYINNIENTYFRFSTDGGTTFSSIFQVNQPAPTTIPHLAVDSGEVIYCAWMDRRNGWQYTDIYFTRGLPEPPGIAKRPRAEGNTLKVYPNPASSYFNLSLPKGVREVEIYNASGKLVSVNEFGGLGVKGLKVSLAEIREGVYFLKVGEEKRKLVIKR